MVPGPGPRLQAVQIVEGEPCGYEQITSLSSAASLTIPPNATMALVQAETQPVRWRDDATAPTSSVGMILYPGNVVQLNTKKQLTNFRAIQTAASAKLNVVYYEKKV